MKPVVRRWGGGRRASPVRAHCVIGREVNVSRCGGEEQAFRISTDHPKNSVSPLLGLFGLFR